MQQEEWVTGRGVLQQPILNAEAAKEQRIPFCQVTGYEEGRNLFRMSKA